MGRKKKDIYTVDIKPRWNGIAKFYLICIILFVLFVAYILIYREVHKEEIIQNLINQNNTVTENIIK